METKFTITKKGEQNKVTITMNSSEAIRLTLILDELLNYEKHPDLPTFVLTDKRRNLLNNITKSIKNTYPF